MRGNISPSLKGRVTRVLVELRICLVILVATLACLAQTSTPTPTEPAETGNKNSSTTTGDAEPDQAVTDKPKKEKRGSWILAPIPINSPTFGVGMIAVVGYVFQFKEDDKLSAPSTIGAAVPFTNNGSRALISLAQLNFGENKYRTTFAFGKGRANLDFYGIGRIPGRPAVSVFIEGTGAFGFAEALRNVGKNIFVGPRYQYRKITVAVNDPTPPGGFAIPPIDLRSTTAALGFRVLRDTRDSTFYPTKGAFWDFKGDFFAKAVGSNRTYQTYKATYNRYITIGDRQVLAYRAMGCSTSRTTPFYDLCLFGSSSDLRGYTTGQFQNNKMLATQVEYRRELKWRLGVVGFAGIGSVANGWSDFRYDELLPAAGVGLRFKLDKKNHINYRVDVGYGRVGPTLIMSVTEAF